jgi:hypothetical protein
VIGAITFLKIVIAIRAIAIIVTDGMRRIKSAKKLGIYNWEYDIIKLSII